MKNAILSVILITVLIATTPLISIAINSDKNATVQSNATVASDTKKDTEKISDKITEPGTKKEIATEKSTFSAKTNSKSDDYSFKIYDKATKEIITVSDFDFCCGALATEIETDIPEEAIKAQAVAIHTYYSYLRSNNRADKEDYDFECNSKIWETYVSKDELKEKWGETFDESYKIISDAVSEVSGTFVLYDNKLCMTKYFEISSGNTNSYKEIYGEDIPYLVSVPSPFDTVANNYKTEIKFTKEEFDNSVKEKFSDYKPGDISKNISDISKNDYGTVLNIKVGNIETTGKELAKTLNLRSSTFEVNCSDDTYTFATYGYGENIGMSQFGMCQMAKQGNSYIEILKYYYPNTTISDSFKPI